MAKRPSVRELRLYRHLFDQAAGAKDESELAQVAEAADLKVEHWLLRETIKDKLYDRARALGVPCRRDRDLCFAWLVERAQPQVPLFQGKTS